MKDTPIKKVMTSEVIVIGQDRPIADAVALFAQHHFHHLPVIDEAEQVVGILSSTDVERLRTGGSLFKNEKREEYDEAMFQVKCVEEIMTRQIITLSADQTVMDAYRIFKDNQFRCVPIVEDDQLIGILTQIDMLTYLFESDF